MNCLHFVGYGCALLPTRLVEHCMQGVIVDARKAIFSLSFESLEFKPLNSGPSSEELIRYDR